MAEETATLFPTEVIIVFPEEMESPIILLARSPHGGCLVSWQPEDHYFEEPCYGSRFSLNGIIYLDRRRAV